MTALRRVLTALVAAGLLLAGAIPAGAVSAPATHPAPAADYPATLAPFYTQTLNWVPCTRGLECSWLTVPLDYADPTGPTIRIRVSRAPAVGTPDQRRGSLLVNPGGPGASGLDFAAAVAGMVSPAVGAMYDIVGFDTRGVGQSAPITCMTGRQTTTFLRADSAPTTVAEQRRLWSLGGRLARGCLSMSPTIARHVGSENTVRDMDVLRTVLGDPALNFIGFSYGTYLGTRYAETFPDSVGRLVLDGALDPSLDIMEVSKGQSDGFQLAMSRFAADCAPRSACPWRGSAARVLTGINGLLARIDRSPMPAQRGTPLVIAEALTALFTAMYTPQFWPELRRALREARAGNGLGLQSIADFASERIGPDRYATNMASAFPAIACWDSPAAPGFDVLRTAADAWARTARIPAMARSMSWGNAPCSQWYGHGPNATGPASSRTTSPIVVVGTTYDPATPYAWARALSTQLTTSTLLTFVGDGHTAYGGNSRCIDDAVDGYLLTGTPPAAGTVCR